MDKVNLQKRESLKKTAILAGAVGVGLMGLSSVANASTMFRSNTKDYKLDNVATNSIGCVIDGAGSAIGTGLKTYIQVPYDCIIKEWTVIADQTGDIVIDVWKDTYANFPPTVADTITASAKPTLSSERIATGSASTWGNEINAGEVLFFNVDSVATVTKISLILKVEKQE
jgi:hypothetical protein